MPNPESYLTRGGRTIEGGQPEGLAAVRSWEYGMSGIGDNIKSEFEKKPNTENLSKGATNTTREAQRRVLSELDFSDRESFDLAT